MEIIWNKNPLCTQVMLDDKEKEILKLKWINAQLEDDLYTALFKFDPECNQLYNPEEGLKRLKTATNCLDPDSDGGKQWMKWIDECVACFIDDLENNPHCGDCTCVACSCDKCTAESLIGVDTLGNVGKHSLYKIEAAFKEDTTIAGALKKLQEPIVATEEWHHGHIERWNVEREHAVKYLMQYRDDHFPDDV